MTVCTENLKMLRLEELEAVVGGAAPSRKKVVTRRSPSQRNKAIGEAISNLVLLIVKHFDQKKN